MLRVEPFRPYHIELIRAQGVQGAQLREVSLVPAACANLLGPAGPALSAFAGERVLLCGGIVIDTTGKVGSLWAVLSMQAPRHMLALHRGVVRFLDIHRYLRRLETTVAKGFAPGCRWVEKLGFRFEGEMPGYGVDGETHLRYGRVQCPI